MSRFYFCNYIDYEDGKMAHVSTVEENELDEIPLNIHIDNADQITDMKHCQCDIDVSGVTYDLEVYPSSEAYAEAGTGYAEKCLIPIGTFSVSEDKGSFTPTAHIFFSGRVLEVRWNPDCGPDEPNCCIRVATLGFEFSLYLEYHGEIGEGYIVSGTAWLFGKIEAVFPLDICTDTPEFVADGEEPDEEEDDFPEEEHAVSTDEMVRRALGAYVRMTCKNTDLPARYEGRIDEYTVRAPGWISSVEGRFLRVGSRSFRRYEIQDIEVLWGTEADVLRGKITGETIQDYILPLTDEQLALLAAELEIDPEDLPFLPEDRIGDIRNSVVRAGAREDGQDAERSWMFSEIAAVIGGKIEEKRANAG